jgi:hypothetical protein
MPVVLVNQPALSYHLTTTPGAPTQAGYANATAFITQVVGGTGLTYYFPYAPLEVSFSNVGAEYQEITRTGDYSLVNRRAPKLLKASFSFRIAHRPSNGLQPIDDDIELLRRMANEDATVAIIGLGAFFSGIAGSAFGSGTNVTFRIFDLNIKVVQRSEFDNSPWQADCDIELVEDRNPTFVAAVLSPIVYDDEPIQTTKSGGVSGNGGGKKNSPTPPLVPPINYTGLGVAPAGTTSRAYSLKPKPVVVPPKARIIYS